MYKNGIAGACLLVLAGCGFVKTNEVYEGVAHGLPNDRLLAYQQRDADSAAIMVTRDTGFLGGGCYVAFAIDGTLSARFDTGEMARFYVPPGSHELALLPDPLGKGLCGIQDWSPVRATWEFSSDKLARYRLSLRQFRRPELEPIE